MKKFSLYPLGAFVAVIGLVFCLVGAANTNAYGQRLGPTPGAILIFIVGCALVGIQLYRNTRTP